MEYAAIIGAAVAAIGAAISAGQNAQAQAIRQKVADQIGAEHLPVLDKLVAHQLPPDAAARYQQATQATQSQGSALAGLQSEVNARGETPEDRAAYMRSANEADSVESAGRSATDRGMAARGLAGSGMQFALEQQGNQAATNRANQEGVQEAADSRGRYLTALNSLGSLGSTVRGQDMAALGAQDSINEFNVREQTATDAYNANLPQQNFENSMAKDAAQANALNGVAAGYERSAGATQAAASGIGNAINTMGDYQTDANGNPIERTDANGNPIKKKGGT